MRIKSTYFIAGIHIITWTLFFIIAGVIFSDIKITTGLPANYFLYTNIYHVALFYFNAYIVFPKLATAKKWPLYILSVPAMLAFSYYIKIFFLQLTDPSFQVTSLNHRIIFFPPVPFIIAGIILQVILRRLHADKLQKEQQAARLASELKFLRNQVSPHFLFNTMTNMVSLARQKSDLLEPSLIKLSELLRYMLYEPGEETFNVGNEIAYLKNYIELQQLRFGDDVEIRLQVDADEQTCLMEPMLLIPFVENAFKHGIGMVHKPYIHIAVSVKEQQLLFSVINSYSRQNNSKDRNSGIGLQNVKNRLQLLYPGKYSLRIKDIGNIFKAELKLTLTC
ncbi:MAG TPA: histidine kinase [Chitinophagaceae bacterium]|nr:histidine kinase [Chitinophagaceae bacterium]